MGDKAYSHYLDVDIHNQGFLLRIAFLISLNIAMLPMVYREGWNKLDLVIRRLIFASFGSVIILPLVSIITSTLADRISYYFIIISSFLLLHLSKYLVVKVEKNHVSSCFFLFL